MKIFVILLIMLNISCTSMNQIHYGCFRVISISKNDGDFRNKDYNQKVVLQSELGNTLDLYTNDVYMLNQTIGTCK